METVERSAKVTRILLIAAISIALCGATYSFVSSRLAAERLYDEAVAAEEKGDFETARAKYSDVIQTNPSFKDSKDRIAAVKKKIAIQNDPRLAAVYAADEKKQNPTTKRMVRPKKIKPTEDEPGIGSGKLKLSFRTGVKTLFNSNDLPGYKMSSSNATKISTQRVYQSLKADTQLQKLTVKTTKYDDPQQLSDAIYSFKFEYPRNQQTIWIRGTGAYYGNNGKNQSVFAWTQGSELYSIEAEQTTSTPPGASLGPLMNLVP